MDDSVRAGPPQRSSSAPPTTEGAVEAKYPLGPPFVPCTKKLKKKVLYVLSDLVSSINCPRTRCCFWHSTIIGVEALLQEMRSWHDCNDGWLPHSTAQCDTVQLCCKSHRRR